MACTHRVDSLARQDIGYYYLTKKINVVNIHVDVFLVLRKYAV